MCSSRQCNLSFKSFQSEHILLPQPRERIRIADGARQELDVIDLERTIQFFS